MENKKNMRNFKERSLQFFRADRDGILPIHLYKPEGRKSESKEFFQATLQQRSDFPQQQGVVVVAAHQDDETEFFGAAIASLSQKGYPVTVVHMTDGRYGADTSFQRKDMSRLVRIRLEESLAAARELNIYRVINLGVADTFVGKGHDLTMEQLIRIFREENPAVIITQADSTSPQTSDGHPDHIHTFPLVRDSAFRASLHLYQSRRRTQQPIREPALYTWDPQSLHNVFGELAPVGMLIDATAYEEQKQRAFSLYRTQIGNRPDGGSYLTDRVKQDKIRGGGIFMYAEGLTQYKPAQFQSKNMLQEMLGEDAVVCLFGSTTSIVEPSGSSLAKY